MELEFLENNIVDYHIIHTQSISSMNVLVREYIKDGWSPYQPLVSYEDRNRCRHFVMEMVKYEPLYQVTGDTKINWGGISVSR